MPTTIDRVGRTGLLLGGAGALAVWFLGMAVAALAVEPQNVIVFAPQAVGVVAGADGLVLTSGRSFVIARAQGRNFVQRLYREGAWLVWPSVPRGCFGF